MVPPFSRKEKAIGVIKTKPMIRANKTWILNNFLKLKINIVNKSTGATRRTEW